MAAVMADGSILLQIGGCCDRGELWGRGSFRDGRIEGEWYQQFLDRGPEGTFVMIRRE